MSTQQSAAFQGKIWDTHWLTSIFFHPTADQFFSEAALIIGNKNNTWQSLRCISIKQLKLTQL